MWVVSSAVMVTYLQAVCALIMVVVVVVMTVVVVMVVVMIFIISKVVVHGTAGYVGVQEVVRSAVMIPYLQAVSALMMVVVVMMMVVVVVMIFIISKVVVHGTAGYVGVQEVVRSAVMIPYLQAVSALIMMMVFIMMMMVVVTIRRQRVIMARSGNRRLPRLQDRL